LGRLGEVVEVAVSGIGDDEQLLVLGVGIGFANKLIALCLGIKGTGP